MCSAIAPNQTTTCSSMSAYDTRYIGKRDGTCQKNMYLHSPYLACERF